jgi:hypothetical protein
MGAFFRRHDSPDTVRERLRRAVAALARARGLQLLVDHVWGGLLAGLSLATVLVLASRLVSLPFPAWKLATAAVILPVLIALGLAWWRRPDPLQVAIEADLALRLKQRLSTAWEFATRDGDEALADRLAAQAVRAGLPARPALVFPLRVNRWGRLAPLAAITLVLASIVELPALREPAPRPLDVRVVEEGQRLGEFGRAMRSRAEREKLARSTPQAAALERLGARMQSGALSRSQALDELRRMAESLDAARMEAQAEAAAGAGGSERAGRAQPAPGRSSGGQGSALERMEKSGRSSEDIRALRQRLDDLEKSGIPRREIESALDRHPAGAEDPLADILERLAQLGRALKDDKELRSAQAQVRRSQENLGDSAAQGETGRGINSSLDWDEDERGDRGLQAGAAESPDGRRQNATGRQASNSASQADASGALEPGPAPSAEREAQTGPVLSAQGQMREGESFSSEGRTLPRARPPEAAHVELDARFAPQVEQVLANEQYPAHFKEFVRRYFMTLSEAERPGAQPDKRGTR